MNFELVESAVPLIGEVEDRHVEHKHRIVPLPASSEQLPPSMGEILSLDFHFHFSFPKESSTIYFLVHSFGSLLVSEDRLQRAAFRL